ncbi:MAG: amidohydrolase [Rubrivivax sp.]
MSLHPEDLDSTRWLLRGARAWGHDGAVDLLLDQGRIARIGTALPTPPGVTEIDAAGLLALPALVDAHAHLDKTLWGQPWHPNQAGPSLMDKILHEREVLARLQLSAHTQSAALLRHLLACGTTRIRTHVDVVPPIGLQALHGVLEMREAQRERADIQVVAFPQMGVTTQPGTLALLEQAVKDGAEVLGGLDPMGIDRDPKGQLDGLFDIAARHGCELDIHLHDRGELGAVTIEMVAERVAATGLRGKVSLSHAFCLGQLEPARLDQMIRLLLDHEIAVMTHAPSGPTPFPPVRLLHEAGVRLFSGSDGVRDTWGPLNNGDMLERAYLIAYRSGFRDDAGLELALAMCSTMGARRLGVDGHGLHEGAQADLLLVRAETPAEAVVMHPPRDWVFRRGRVVGREGRCVG